MSEKEEHLSVDNKFNVDNVDNKIKMGKKEEHLNVDDKIQLQTWVVSPCQHLEPPDKSFKEDQQKFQTS